MTILLCGLVLGCGKGGSGSSNPRLKQAMDRLAAAGSPEERFAALGDAAKQCLAAGKTAEAQQYARELLDQLPSQRTQAGAGDANHDAHTVLGRIAVREGRLDEAKQHLAQSVRQPGQRMMDYGPRMSLAKDLLEKGERQAVLDYLNACSQFWSRERLEQWSREVQEGKVPDFPANLLD